MNLKACRNGIADFSEKCEFHLIVTQSLEENVKRYTKVIAEQSAASLHIAKDLTVEVLSEDSDVISHAPLNEFLTDAIDFFDHVEAYHSMQGMLAILESVSRDIKSRLELEEKGA